MKSACRGSRVKSSGAVALAVGVAAAWLGADLFKVAVSCCAAVFLLELFLKMKIMMNI